MKLERIYAREVLDSRGRPTVEAEVILDGARGRSIAPSGASTGTHEALELRDAKPTRFSGFGVRKAVANVNSQIASQATGRRFNSIADFDRFLIELDGTSNKSTFGANAILAASLAFAHAFASASNQPLYHLFAKAMRGQPSMPLPMINILSGGLHAGRQLDFQDFLIVPHGAKSIMQALEWTHEIYKVALSRCVKKTGYNPQLVADEGGIGPNLPSNAAALVLLSGSIRDAGFSPGTVGIAVDVAASHFYSDGVYQMKADGKRRTSRAMVTYLERLADKHPVISIEDGLAEDDWDGWELLTERLGPRLQLLGDDLFVTNTSRLQQGIDRSVANAVLIKLNQIGTVTETLQAMSLARQARYGTVVSARSGETEDATMSDLAVGSGAAQIKIGSITRSSRLAKYNQLLRLSENADVAHWKKRGWAWDSAAR
ncbi:MAG: phosphopyruvate hydratase [Candidatus Sumerlaeaceae bacterium]